MAYCGGQAPSWGPSSRKGATTMASLLGNLIYAGQLTILTTQATMGPTANLYSINTGALQNLDVALFAPAQLGSGTYSHTMQVLLHTRTGTTVVYANPNTNAVPGEVLAAYFHSIVR